MYTRRRHSTGIGPKYMRVYKYHRSIMFSSDDAELVAEENNTHENATQESPHVHFKMIIRNTSTVYYLILIIFGVIGNGLVIFTYHTRAKLRVVSCNLFIVQMSQVNLIVVCLIDPMIMYSTYTQKRTIDIMCKMWIVVMEVCAGVTAFFIIAIAVNRYFLIVHPRLFRRLCTPKRIKIIVVLVWLFVVSVSAFVMMRMGVKRDHVTHRCMLDNSTALARFFNNFILYCFFLPLMIVVPFAHALTLSAIRKSRRRVKCQMQIPNISLSNINVINDQVVNGANNLSGHPSHHTLHPPTRNVQKFRDEKRPTHAELDSISSCTSKTPFRHSNTTPNDKQATTNLTVSRSSRETPSDRDNRVPLNTSALMPSVSPMVAKKLPSRETLISRSSKKRELPLIRMMSVLYVVLCLSWVPWWMKNLLSINEESVTTTVMYTLAWCNPIYYSFSPYIYALSNRNFRVAYGDVFRSVVCKCDS